MAIAHIISALLHNGEPVGLEHTFYAMGSHPILFVCKSMSGTKYLCSCCKLLEEYIAVKTTASTLSKLISEEITIREAFESSPGPKLFIAWNKDTDAFDASNEIPEDALPEKGALLDLEYEKNSHYHNVLASLAIVEMTQT